MDEFPPVDVADDISLGGYESDLTCQLCNQTFLTLRDLEQHILIHAEGNKEFKPFKCPQCDKVQHKLQYTST